MAGHWRFCLSGHAVLSDKQLVAEGDRGWKELDGCWEADELDGEPEIERGAR